MTVNHLGSDIFRAEKCRNLTAKIFLFEIFLLGFLVVKSSEYRKFKARLNSGAVDTRPHSQRMFHVNHTHTHTKHAINKQKLIFILEIVFPSSFPHFSLLLSVSRFHLDSLVWNSSTLGPGNQSWSYPNNNGPKWWNFTPRISLR